MRIFFTFHAELRMIKRGIAKEEVIDAISYPDRIIKKEDTYYYQKSIERGKIEVVCQRESNIKVIAIYWV